MISCLNELQKSILKQCLDADKLKIRRNIEMCLSNLLEIAEGLDTRTQIRIRRQVSQIREELIL